MSGAFVLALAACGGNASPTTASDSTTTLPPTQTTGDAASSSTTTIPIAGGAATTTSSMPVSTTPQASSSTTLARTTTIPDEPVVLEGTAFGGYQVGEAIRDDVVGFVVSFFGEPTRVRDLVDEEYTTCPSGSDEIVSWFDELMLVFGGDVFAGYLWSTSDLPFATPEGLQVNMAVSDLIAAYPGVDISETSLGWEWFDEASGLRGFVSGPTASDAVLSIGGRDICAFR